MGVMGNLQPLAGYDAILSPREQTYINGKRPSFMISPPPPNAELPEDPTPIPVDVDRMIASDQSSFQSLSDAVPVGILQTDGEGNSIFCNSTWKTLTCHSVDGDATQHWTSIIHPSDRASVIESWQMGLKQRTSWSTVCRLTPGGTTIRWIRLRVNPVVTAEGPGCLATAEDITSVRKAEAELQEYAHELEAAKAAHERNAEELALIVDDLEFSRQRGEAAVRAKGEFLANMSHEIRTPMTAILGYIDILIEENAGRNRNLELLDVMKRNGDFLLEIINDILDLSKIEAGKMQIEQIASSPLAIVADVKSLMYVRTEAKDLPLNTDFSGPIPETILTDPTRVRQILINLVSNAVKFTERGSVTVRIRFLPANDSEQTPDKLEFEVTDTGVGMSPEMTEKLFESFSQGDTSVTRRFGGTGLGLAISRRLANLLGGDISVRSRLGQGSTFTLTIDAHTPPDARMIDHPNQASIELQNKRRTQAKESALGEKPLKGCEILIAEDGPDNQRLLSFLIKKAGGSVAQAENGQVACEMVRDARENGRPYHAVLMDMQMPVLDGYRATQRLRKEGDTTPVIALTAHAMAGDRQKCIDAGCDDYATKPIDRKKLYSTIIKQVNAHQSAQQRAGED